MSLEAVPYLLGAGGILTVCGALLSARQPAPRRARETRISLRGHRRSRPGPARAPTPEPAVAPPAASAPALSATDQSPPPPGGTPAAVAAARSWRPTMHLRRVDNRALAELSRELRNNRLRAVARARLGEELAALDRGVWHVERDVIAGGVTMPCMIFGPTGVFGFSAGHAWNFPDLRFLAALGTNLGAMIPGYPDPVCTGVYLPFEEHAPRSWFDGQGDGGWIVGRGELPGVP